jgi:hypothetical protein
MDNERRIRLRDKDLAWRALENEVVVLDLRTSMYLSVNQTGALLWTRLVNGATEEELVSVLLDAFDVGQERAHADVAGFLAICTDRNWLEPAG